MEQPLEKRRQRHIRIKTGKKSENKVRQNKLKTSNFNKSHQLFNLMFFMPYLKINLLEKKEIGHRQTASLYLKKLVNEKIVEERWIGRNTYYINYKLMAIITQRKNKVLRFQ